jgi:hypothetical protein
MRKLISMTMIGLLMSGLGIGLSGCSDQASEKKETTITSPGGKRIESETKSVKTTGDNPPPPSKTP